MTRAWAATAMTLGALLLATSCRAPAAGAAAGPPVELDYVGSSTVAVFLRDAESAYRGARFRIDTAPESEGGERAVAQGRAQLAGIADVPRPETLRQGVASALIGRDAIAIIVNARNPVNDVSLADLRLIFTGEIRNWREVGGPDLELTPFIVGAESATRRVFRESVLDGSDYAGCREVKPDAAIVDAVAAEAGGIGQISFSFLPGASGVRAIAVDGEEPAVVNFDYPITRPLYLLWREGTPALEAFVEWAQSDSGQRVVMRNFVGRRVLGSARAQSTAAERGTLIVYTETYPYYDGGIYYYPHRPYEILSREGAFLRRVNNHRGENDEAPTLVDLAPGTYWIRAESERGEPAEFLVTIDSGRRTELDVVALEAGR